MQTEPVSAGDFDAAARDAVYRAIFTRRDIRGQFLPCPVPDPVLARLLTAAHHAPSVGFMQPWNFIVIRDAGRKAQIRDLVRQARAEEVRHVADDRQALYRSLKLDGIVEAPVNLCITCDRSRAEGSPLGRWHNPEMDLYSTVCAVQNLWLAARAEGLGLGWVSILDKDALKALLALPAHVTPVAYLCLGYVSDFADRPELESKGWRKRLALDELISAESWAGGGEDALKALIRSA
ncbi:5,6-dimethylbenzimidazole synthase [Nordella sp. HKS 07]|uniref:5,6-dimethylbenzimidazole synthase n=1 Tax=Nordella sp. HKS 07 TaxID=2712222 RepID=UPI0013E1A616|nr:5,6-dimethylbenzimidazole synthase [Nordella sp. HKS 07]QIG51446.1 5,6-dimethylbenzimidazole synthase [Nordella sp. HKS 07]